MNTLCPDLQRPIQFVTDSEGKPTAVTLEPAAYVALLVRANVTESGLWPPGSQDGAAALVRIRKIERDCISEYGEFDWEKLSESVQDEYDSLCGLLDRLQDTGERTALTELLRPEEIVAP